jgi:hypothetical protein
VEGKPETIYKKAKKNSEWLNEVSACLYFLLLDDAFHLGEWLGDDDLLVSMNPKQTTLCSIYAAMEASFFTKARGEALEGPRWQEPDPLHALWSQYSLRQEAVVGD